MKEKRFICLKCKKEIKNKDKYYKIILYDNGKDIAFDVIHYTCWHTMFNPNEYLKNAMNMIKPMIGGMLQ